MVQDKAQSRITLSAVAVKVEGRKRLPVSGHDAGVGAKSEGSCGRRNDLRQLQVERGTAREIRA